MLPALLTIALSGADAPPSPARLTLDIDVSGDGPPLRLPRLEVVLVPTGEASCRARVGAGTAEQRPGALPHTVPMWRNRVASLAGAGLQPGCGDGSPADSSAQALLSFLRAHLGHLQARAGEASSSLELYGARIAQAVVWTVQGQQVQAAIGWSAPAQGVEPADGPPWTLLSLQGQCLGTMTFEPGAWLPKQASFEGAVDLSWQRGERPTWARLGLSVGWAGG